MCLLAAGCWLPTGRSKIINPLHLLASGSDTYWGQTHRWPRDRKAERRSNCKLLTTFMIFFYLFWLTSYGGKWTNKNWTNKDKHVPHYQQSVRQRSLSYNYLALPPCRENWCCIASQPFLRKYWQTNWRKIFSLMIIKYFSWIQSIRVSPVNNVSH